VKVKNIAFSGFAAAILAAGAANAAPQIASKQYVDDKVKADVQTLQTNIENNYTTTEQLGTVINQNITEAITADDGALKTELGKKQDALTEAQMSAVDSGITAADVAQITTNKDDIAKKADKLTVTAEQAGNVATVDDKGQYQVGTIKAADLVTNETVTSKITEALNSDDSVKEIITTIVSNGEVVTDAINQSVESGTLKTELDKKANKITVSADQVGNIATLDANGQYQVGDVKASDLATADSVSTAIADAVKDGGAVDAAVDTKINTELAEGGAINAALADKANAEDVYTKEAADALFDTKIPVPSEACQADSGRCVLSVVKGSDGKSGLSWIDVTSPLEATTPNTGA